MLCKFVKNSLKSIGLCKQIKFFSVNENDLPPRESMNYNVVIVGAGPAGLATAIKLKQLEQQIQKPISVCLIEKGSAVGVHIISGNVFQINAFEELFPNWRIMENKPPLNQEVTSDKFIFLWDEKRSFNLPHIFLPKSIHNRGNYIISLSDLCKWMADRATELGVDIFPGFAGDEVLYDENDKVKGIATGDLGISKKGEKKSNYTRGVALLADQTIFAEGARGSLSLRVINKYALNYGRDPQTYGMGFKEIWEVPKDNHDPGLVLHTVGWPLDRNTYGGSFMYHAEPNIIHLGFVTALDYKNPYLNLYEEFQRYKMHPDIRKYLEGGNCIQYGGRVLNSGGYFAIPKLTFPGGMLAGCSAGFLNVMKIKGTHNAIGSGILAAESLYKKHCDGPIKGLEITEYNENIKNSWIYKELKETRNFKGAFKYNLYTGMLNAFFISTISRGYEPWNLRNKVVDSQTLDEKTKHKSSQSSSKKEIIYPKHDGKLTFDLLDNLARSGTYHEHDQPSHLRIKYSLTNIYCQALFTFIHRKGKELTPLISLFKYAGPEEKFCPAKVYEFVQDENNQPKLQINAQNCLHCKCCSIKMIDEYIDWNVPEGGGGPNYSGMQNKVKKLLSQKQIDW